MILLFFFIVLKEKKCLEEIMKLSSKYNIFMTILILLDKIDTNLYDPIYYILVCFLLKISSGNLIRP